MKNRILEFLKAENKSSAQLAEEIGVQPSGISHILSGRNNPSLDFVIKMLNKYPALSSEWLLFGRGQMYREPQLNDLFSSPDSAESTERSQSHPQNEDLLSLHDASDSNKITSDVVHSGSRDKQTKKIICFYNDDTFREYYPSKE